VEDGNANQSLIILGIVRSKSVIQSYPLLPVTSIPTNLRIHDLIPIQRFNEGKRLGYIQGIISCVETRGSVALKNSHSH